MKKSQAVLLLSKYMNSQFDEMFDKLDNDEDYMFSVINLLEFVETELGMRAEWAPEPKTILRKKTSKMH